MRCRACCGTLDPDLVFADLGAQPLANALLSSDDLYKTETYWPLKPVVCGKCFLVQLPHVPEPNILFAPDYPFLSGQSVTWIAHCREFADKAINRFSLSATSRVLEIGSNDGTMMRRFRGKGIPVMGIEPATGVAQHANMEGLATLQGWWSLSMAKQLRHTLGVSTGKSWGADLVIANNVLAHVPNLIDFLQGVKHVLSNDGVAVFEFPSVGQLIEEGQFDQIYAEHHSYFSLCSLREALKRADLHMIDAEALDIHGGSYRVYVSSRYQHPSSSLNKLLDAEAMAGLYSLQTYLRFRDRPPLIKRWAWAKLIEETRAIPEPNREHLVVGYGASAKAAVFLNYVGIGPETLEWIADTTPTKWGKYMPGVRIPIVHPSWLSEREPDLVVLLAWNWAKEATERIKEASPNSRVVVLGAPGGLVYRAPSIDKVDQGVKA